jgi:hypothetical protein
MMKICLSIRARRMRDVDDSGAAMITALLAILVTAMFSIVMLGVIMSQITPTRLEQATTQTVYAAETGINVVVGQIRAAAALPDGLGNIYGDTRKLPCSSQGTVGSGSTALSYSVTISYYTEDPTTKDDAWRLSHKLACSSGGPSQDPTHALIQSTGTGLVVQNVTGGVHRTVEAVYAFQVTNTNIPGGFIKSFDGTKPDDPAKYCLEATQPEAGAEVKYVAAATCVEGNAKQLWIYGKDYTIKLAYSTVPTSGLAPLCMTGAPGAGSSKITLTACVKATDPNGYNQLWSWEGGATWQGETLVSGNLVKSGYYMSSGVPNVVSAGSNLQLSTGGSDNTNEWSSFDPDPRIGAGAAGKSTNQIVNYQEFGRCADVTDEDLSRPMEIVYPCKQDPNPSQSELTWNHKWSYVEPTSGTGTQDTTITVTNGSVYCLTSVNADGGYPTFNSCTGAPNQKWTRVDQLDSYDDSYLFKDAYGRCLDVGPTYDDGARAYPWSTIVVNPCGAALSQKWNAPANSSPAALGGYWELTN